MRALISDIHGNADALEAVMKDIEGHEVDDVLFLGDVVGYGPEPEECIDIVEKSCRVRLSGNHDLAMLTVPIGFNPAAAGAIACQRERMEPGIYSMPWKKHRWRFLGNLILSHFEDETLCVHASPRDPIHEYVLPSDPLYNSDKVAAIFERVERVCFVGHSHIPGVLIPEPAWIKPEETDYEYRLGDGKTLVNIGSVGQPRDRDARASYVLWDDDRIVFRRVEYDVQSTMDKIRRNPCLDGKNAERLAVGR